MFNKKKIIIGETYLFDVLNETDMANVATLVTVVKKVGHDEYAVISVNNSSVFKTKSKYLTPYVNKKEAVAIRCKYGTTDIKSDDVSLLNHIRSILSTIADEICTTDDTIYNEKISNDIEKICLRVKELEDKLKPYAEITENMKNLELIKSYKEFIQETAECYERDIANNIKRRDNGREQILNNSQFKEKFDKIVNDYCNGKETKISFIHRAITCVKEDYPIDLLKNCENEPLTEEEISEVSHTINSIVQLGKIVLIIIPKEDEEEKIDVHAYFNDPYDMPSMLSNNPYNMSSMSEEDISDFIHSGFPDILEDNYIPTYKYNVITINEVEIGKEDEEDE